MDSAIITDAKRALRREMRRRRVAIADRAVRSERLWMHVAALCATVSAGLDTGRITPMAVLVFHGVGSEPDTTGLIERLDEARYVVLLPRVEDDHIVAVAHRPGDDLHPGAHGIPAPTGPAVDPTTIDIVIVPGLAFTRDGLRLGQGGGYYDRFLPLVSAACVTCGVAFEEQIVDDLPCEPHDRPLSALITDAVRE